MIIYIYAYIYIYMLYIYIYSVHHRYSGYVGANILLVFVEALYFLRKIWGSFQWCQRFPTHPNAVFVV